MGKTTKAFQENLSVLCDELYLAKQWGKASIIFTIHKSTLSQEKTREALQKELRKIEYSIVEVEINKIEDNFIDYMLQQKNIQNIVFFISNIKWGGGKDEKDGYRILNLYREIFIEQNIKAVFFLTLAEASNLPEYAPDFWAFRHRVLEFRNPRLYCKKQPPAKLMLWHKENLLASIVDIKSKVLNLSKTLSEIPEQDETVSLRIELQYDLAFLYWQIGDLFNLEKTLESGIGLALDYDFPDSLVKLQNGLAILYYEQGNYQGAIDLLDSLVKENPIDCLLLLNQAVVLFAGKKRYNAISRGTKAISICSEKPWVWNSLGFLHYLAGKMDEAVTCFKEAIALFPQVSFFYESLAICYFKIGLQDKAIAQLDQAKNSLDERDVFHDVLIEHFKGNTEKAHLLIRSAISSGKLTKLDIDRDSVLSVIVDSNDAI